MRIPELGLDDVTGSVWLATAIMTFREARDLDPAGGPYPETHFAFRQIEIQETAQALCANKVHNARISQWTNADHEKPTYNYLREVGSRRRLTVPGECNGNREEPDLSLDDSQPLLIDERGSPELKLDGLRAWVHQTFPQLVDRRPVDTGRQESRETIQQHGHARKRGPQVQPSRPAGIARPEGPAERPIDAQIQRLYRLLALLPRVDHRIPTAELPQNGLYIFYERGQEIRSGGWTVDRIVRIGTHNADGRFPGRIRQHYGNRSNLGGHKNASVFRRHVGDALLHRDNPDDPQIEAWVRQGGDGEGGVEERVSRLLRHEFTFSWINVPEKVDRLELERGLIGLLSDHPSNAPVQPWLGDHASNDKIGVSGLWNTQHTTTANPLDEPAWRKLEDSVRRTIREFWAPADTQDGRAVVVPCGSAKIWNKQPSSGPTSAWEAYTGPPSVKNREYAEAFADTSFVLSAKYGLILPAFSVPGPYEVTFKDAATGPIGQEILCEQVRHLALADFDEVIVLGGRDYRDAMAEPLDAVGADWRAPFTGLRLGEQMGAVNRAINSGDPIPG